MEANETRGTLAFKSNLQLVKGPINGDQHFLSSVHDPFALEIMKKMGFQTTTPIQTEEYQAAALHCVYAYKDDYPWGTIVLSDGTQQVVCKCTNEGCIYFKRCRKNFSESELKDAEDNARYLAKIQEVTRAVNNARKSKVRIEKKADADAIIALLESEPVEVEDAADTGNDIYFVDNKTELTEKSSQCQNDLSTDSVSQKKIELSQPDHPKMSSSDSAQKEIIHETRREKTTKTASFDSFIDVDQTKVISLPPEERTVVNAGPGTGKTWTLIEKIKYMLSEEGVAPENILVFCYSRAAVEVVRGRLESAANRNELPLNWREVDVRTFDSFATYLLAWLQENKPDVLSQGFTLESAGYNERIQEAASAIPKFKDVLADYQHVIVDEVQDLVSPRAEMVLALLRVLPETCGFTILGDSCQSLYDYLARQNDNVKDSRHFYQEIFRTFADANFYSFSHNYRQGDKLSLFTAPLRKEILTGNDEDRTKVVEKLNSELLTADIDLKKFSADTAKKFTKKGTLGILTRTNVQALLISSWLHAQEINHNLQKPLTSQSLASWIGKVLLKAETDVIDFNEFDAIFGDEYPAKKSDSRRYWDALTSTQKDETKRHFEIEDLLRGLLYNAKNPLLFEEPSSVEQKITVSNIFRAKGREFDSVLVLENLFENCSDKDSDEGVDEDSDASVDEDPDASILEDKVRYVALTRAKKDLEKIKFPKKKSYERFYSLEGERRRYYMSGGRKYNGHYLSFFEVGGNSDFDMESFAQSKIIQKHIIELPINSRVTLQRCREGTESYVLYSIVPEEHPDWVLGYTTASFAADAHRAIRQIFKDNNWKFKNIGANYYPERLNEIYVNGLTTCISGSNSVLKGAKKIGNMYFWFGLDLTGFAQREFLH